MPKIVLKYADKSKTHLVYVKSIDREKGELLFTENRDEARSFSSGFWINAEIDFIKFNFKYEYPEYDIQSCRAD